MTQKKKGLKKWLICGRFINTCKLGANSNGKNIKNHKPWFKNYKIFSFCNNLFFQSIVLDFKLYISQRFNILVKSILCNHKSHAFNLPSLCITPKIWKLWNSFVHIVILKFMITFKWICVSSFHSTIKVNGLSNNTLFMFWNMNLKLLLKFLTYTSWLQSI